MPKSHHAVMKLIYQFYLDILEQVKDSLKNLDLNLLWISMNTSLLIKKNFVWFNIGFTEIIFLLNFILTNFFIADDSKLRYKLFKESFNCFRISR